MTRGNITNEQLIAFAAGELTGEEAERIRACIATDTDAARTVSLYRMAQKITARDDTVSPPAETIARAKRIFQTAPAGARPGWLEKVDAIVASLIYDSRLQPAAVRYADASARFQLSFETAETEVDLQAEREEESSTVGAGGRWRLIGQVSAEEDPGVIEVALLGAGGLEPISLTRSDERSVFTFDVEPGIYDLRLRLPGAVVVLERIELQ